MDKPIIALIIGVISAVIAGIILAVLHIGGSSGSANPPPVASERSAGVAQRDSSTPSSTASAATSPALEKALLPASTIGAAATVKDISTDLANLEGICGKPEIGAKLAASELIWSGTTPVLGEIIGYWGTPELADQYIADDRDYLAANADGCSQITYGTTIESKGVYPFALPSACINAGARLATGQFTKSPSGTFQATGFIIEIRCGDITFSISTSTGSLDAAQLYLNSAISQFSATGDTSLEK